MIPQNFKDIISNTENANLFQIIAMIIFIILFLGLVVYVMNKPKKYYEKEENTPLSEDN
ncbi:MAG: CcoQ/FixQ family Cbb3-type cytochrome c oxidase assembly chaperone [Bergeyella sp.]|nr:CcoQ/FixQ family Cbb3-type cytochrome c oxidase assembly chaperone [Bergeyella sp.]